MSCSMSFDIDHHMVDVMVDVLRMVDHMVDVVVDVLFLVDYMVDVLVNGVFQVDQWSMLWSMSSVWSLKWSMPRSTSWASSRFMRYPGALCWCCYAKEAT